MNASHIRSTIALGDVSTTTTRRAVLHVPETSLITKVSFNNAGAVAADATDKVTVTVNRLVMNAGRTAIASTTQIAQITTDSGVTTAASTTTGVTVSAALVSKIPVVAELGALENTLVAALGDGDNGYKQTSGPQVESGDAIEVIVVTAGTTALTQATVGVFYRPGQN